MYALEYKLTVDMNYTRATIVSVRLTMIIGVLYVKRLIEMLRWYSKVCMLKLTSLSKEDRERVNRRKRRRVVDKLLDNEVIVESALLRHYGKTTAIVERLHKDKKAYMVVGDRKQLFTLQNTYPQIKNRIVCIGKESLRGHDFFGASIIYVDELPAEYIDNLVLATHCSVAGFIRY